VATLVSRVAIGMVAFGAAAGTASAVEDVPNVLAGVRLFVNQESPAKRQADAWRRSRPADAALMDRIASQPVAQWFGGWNADVKRDVRNVSSQASSSGALPVLVAYNIPNRDCGSHSAGGERDAGSYRKWIRAFADGLGGRRAVVVLEPDAVAQMDCLNEAQRGERLGMLQEAVGTLKSAGALVYIDAGHANWHKPEVVAERLQRAGISRADGFALNVSNYISTEANIKYGEALSQRTGGKHFVIDTGRNGNGGASGQWCNVGGQALGRAPTTRTGHSLVDALLWIKTPGESDGTCGGGPRAGEWWGDYALGLAKRQPTT
jgi:endoglucanase